MGKTMGFLAKNEPEQIREALPESEVMYRFDSGREIGFADAMMHMMVSGQSGSGKTTSAGAAIIDSTIAHVPTVVVNDVKGSLAEIVLGAAEKYGRLDDVVIYGTVPAATPLNIIEGMSSSRLFDFVMGIFRHFCDGGKSHNMDFHATACATFRDVYTVVKGISELSRAQKDAHPFSNPAYSAPTLPLVLDLMNDPKEATKIFQEYIKLAEKTPEMCRFIKRIQNSIFHVLNQTKDDDKIDNDHEQQVSYNSGGAIRAVSSFLDEPGVIERFCRPGAPGLDFNEIEGKIIVPSFGPGSGGAAAVLCRLVQEGFYEWVYRQGVGGQRKLIICDEYQEIADLSNRKLSDPGFFALAREFNCGGVLLFQSLSAIAAKNGEAGMDALMSNFATKIFLRTEDPLTRETARSLGAPDLIDLNKQAFAVTYDSRTREFAYGLETMNDAYALYLSLPRVKPKPYAVEPVEHGVGNLSKTIEWLVSEEKLKFQSELWKKEMKSVENAVEQRLDKDSKRDWEKVVKKRSHMKMHDYEPSHYDETVELAGEVPFWDASPEKMAEANKVEPPKYGPDDFRILYSNFFKKDADVYVPKGFIPFICKVFDLMEKMGIELTLDRLSFGMRHEFEGSGAPQGNINFLNRYLSCAKKVCAQCGKEIEPNILNLCESCSSPISKHIITAPARREMPYAR